MDYLLFVCVVTVLCAGDVVSQRYKTIYQKIQQESAYSEFTKKILNNNNVAKIKLHYEQLTIFVPENAAFRHSKNKNYSCDTIFYHMSYEVKTLAMLARTTWIPTVFLENPPLWITKRDDDLYVNNAKIIRERSDFLTRSRTGDMGKDQVLHVIDSVLDPIIPSPQSSPSAYDFLTSIGEWNLGAAKTVSNFLTKVQENKLQYVFQQNAGHTYFIPIDSGIGPYKFKMINKGIVFGHIVPFYVLFTRPTPKNTSYETLADEDSVYIVVSFEENDGKTYVKGLMKSENNNGEFHAEIIVPNIPVRNGVVHLISEPLGIYTRKLKPFPYVSVLDKLSTNPDTDVFYQMGQDTGFNKIFTKENISFTYFIPNDSAWRLAAENLLEPVETQLDILSHHLIMSHSPYSIEQLLSLTKANNYTDIELQTKGGVLRIMVLQIKGEYFLKWHNRYIKILRANYECTDGVIHILASPLTNFRRKDQEIPQLADTFKLFLSQVNDVVHKIQEYNENHVYALP